MGDVYEEFADILRNHKPAQGGAPGSRKVGRVAELAAPYGAVTYRALGREVAKQRSLAAMYDHCAEDTRDLVQGVALVEDSIQSYHRLCQFELGALEARILSGVSSSGAQVVPVNVDCVLVAEPSDFYDWMGSEPLARERMVDLGVVAPNAHFDDLRTDYVALDIPTGRNGGVIQILTDRTPCRLKALIAETIYQSRPLRPASTVRRAELLGTTTWGCKS